MEHEDFDELDFQTEQPQEAFHVEVDIFDTGDYGNLLIIPCNSSYIVVGNNEHLCTLTLNCEGAECWEQQEGGLNDELVEKIGGAIQGYISSL